MTQVDPSTMIPIALVCVERRRGNPELQFGELHIRAMATGLNPWFDEKL